MTRKILIFSGIALFVIIAILFFNTFRAKPWPVKPSDAVQQPLPDSAVLHMSQAVQIPTISISDTSAIDTIAFKAFNSFIARAYPLIHQHLSKTFINQFSIVFEWKGLNDSMAPFILMGHYDVVPVEAAALDKWTVPPFSGAITDTCVWGRGTVDDKFGVISILEGTEAMLRKGFVPQRTIYLCFGHDEEISGRSAGDVVKYLEQKKVRAEMVLDEGGQLSESRIKDVKRPIAVIGVAEKGYASFELSVEKEGGHSSMPAKETAIDILNTAIYKLRRKMPPFRLTPQLIEFLERIGPSSDNFMNRMAATNLWLFKPLIKAKLSEQPEGDAMMHTTIVPTIIESGVKDNIVPGNAKAIINSRILSGETSKTVEEYIRKAIGDDRVKIKKVGKFNSDPSSATSTQSPAFKRIESALYRIVPNVLPAPYQGIGATDSRYYRRISDGVVNFFPLTDAKGFHGINERVPLSDLQRGINFIVTILEESNKEFR
jgi:carboxypeptidase PM20D1